MPSKGRSISRNRRAGTVAIVGRANVGKSTLLNALLGEPIAITSPHPQTTRATVRGILTRNVDQFVLMDAPGFHEPRSRLGELMNAAAWGCVGDADAALVLVAPRRGSADANQGDRSILSRLPDVPIVVAINKIDRVAEKAALLPLMASLGAVRSVAATVPISARTGEGLPQLLDAVGALLPVQPWLFDADTLSDQPTRFFVSEYVREQVLRHLREEVPHGVAVEIARYDEREDTTAIEVTLHAAKESHTKILVGSEGRTVKLISAAARARIERLLARKVRLRIRVRTSVGWMDDSARLARFGYDASVVP